MPRLTDVVESQGQVKTNLVKVSVVISLSSKELIFDETTDAARARIVAPDRSKPMMA